MPIEVREDPASTHPPSKTFKPIRLLGWYVVDTDAPLESKYLNTDGVWRGCASIGWWRSREEAEAAAARHKHQWFDSGMMSCQSCRVCGVVKQRSGSNVNKRCKGPIRVGPRHDAERAASKPEDNG